MTRPERQLTWFLRGTAVVLIAAAPAVVLPSSWMQAIGAEFGLDVPASPLVEYLTRSLSGVYGLLGVVLWMLSGDVRRYLPLLKFLVPSTAAFDATLIALDLWIPMPLIWTAGEAISIVVWTALMFWLTRRMVSE
jgi:hypothetical protein